MTHAPPIELTQRISVHATWTVQAYATSLTVIVEDPDTGFRGRWKVRSRSHAQALATHVPFSPDVLRTLLAHSLFWTPDEWRNWRLQQVSTR